MHWTPILPNLWLFRDSCNVYALQTKSALLLIDAGTGAWIPHLHELPQKPAALLCTHYFRDHSAGALAASSLGIPIHVPEGEHLFFADPQQHFRERETYIIYDNTWDLFAPIESIPVAGALKDYDRINLAGIDIEVIPLPGVTYTQSGFGVILSDGRRAVFCGEAIHSPGRMARIAPLQYNYNDLNGAGQADFSARALRQWRPDILLPSLGDPMCSDADAALALLQKNLRHLAAPRPDMTAPLNRLDSPPLERITDHLWLDRHSMANTWYLLSDSRKILAIDYGYNAASCLWSWYPRPAHRRALLHGLDGLKAQFGIDRIDTVLVSHFHDDHVSGIPVLQRLHATQCWAAENFADLLEQPHAHCFPCGWPVPIQIDRRLPLDKEFTWEEYTFRLHPMSGHTRFASLIAFTADGKRFAHTGDQYFFANRTDGFASAGRSQNHVYRNGALLDGYDISGRWMLDWRPEIVLQGHQPTMFTDDAFFRHIEAWPQDYAQTHRQIMPLADSDTHFNLDSWAGWIWPYRTLLKTPAPITVTATVRNPFPYHAKLTLRLVGPKGWQGETATLAAPPRAEISCPLTILPAGPCRRQPIAIELSCETHSFGQIAEALVTIGSEYF